MSEPKVPDPTLPPEHAGTDAEPVATPDAGHATETDAGPAAEELGAEALAELGADANEDAVERVSLSGRLRQTKTIVSILVPLAIIARFVGLNWATLSKVPGLIAGASPILVLAAFAIFYVGFPMRGLRWSMLLRATGLRIGVKDATEILYLSWLVNCLVPAKLGDVYRAYLLRINSDASLSRTFGTVFIERILDIFTIAILGIAAGYWSFRSGLPSEIQVLFGVAVVIVVLLGVALFTLRNFGRRILVALPFPHRVVELYDRFEDGVFSALDRRQLPGLVLLGVGIWMTEALRLFFVVKALGFPGVELGISGAVFVALIGSLLTAVPLSPAGLGIVEAGIVGVLTVVYKVPLAEATAIALLDRVISVFSVIVFGSLLYLVSGKPKGAGLTHRTEATAPAGEGD
ncbi:MAG TPA: lysylphosphatidylglycerol synthase transmembrane domain-containing protein, partial [Myxococcaceae bacterium]|nr:lysylphosphatidylglycerol synthase transmembrane domain-containing protein [Myxococcaceae bacterium]